MGTSDLLHWNGRAWSAVFEPPQLIQGLWGSGPEDVWAVGGWDLGGEVAHRDANGWRDASSGLPSYTPGLLNVWGSGPSDVSLTPRSSQQGRPRRTPAHQA